MTKKLAVITGFGAGLSESLAVRLIQDHYLVAGLSRSGDFGREFEGKYPEFMSRQCDVGDAAAVKNTVASLHADCGATVLLVHNAAQLLLEDFLQIAAEDFEAIWRTCCLGAVNVTHQVLPAMLKTGGGTLIYTGATASVKAGAQSAAFASAKFALRGFAQSLARAYGSQGVHVIHTILDGVIWGERAEHKFKMSREDCMYADDIADSYMALIAQRPSSWTHEMDLRPSRESF